MIRSPGSSEPETHCHRPGRMRPGDRLMSRISGRSTARAVMPTRNIQQSTRSGRNGLMRADLPVGYDRRGRGAARDASGRGRRRRAATRRSATGRRAGGPAGTGSVSWPATVRAERSIRRWLWAILRRSVGSVGVRRAGDAGNDRRRIRPASGPRPPARPRGTGRHARRRRGRSPGRRSSPPRRPGAAGRSPRTAVSTNAARAVGQRAELRHDPVRAAGRRHASAPRAGR